MAVANIGSLDASVLLNNGDGTFADQARYPVESQPDGVALADLDGDGDQDMVVANGRSSSVLLNNGDGTFAPEIRYASGSGPGVALGDLDGDGDVDMVVTDESWNSNGDVSVLLNQCGAPEPCNVVDLASPYTVLDLDDIVVFVTAFLDNDPVADLAEPFGVYDQADINAFVEAFVAGCP